MNDNGMDDRIRLTARIAVKAELEAAVRRTLDRFQQADALILRDRIERLMLDVLTERIDRTATDPTSRIRLPD